MQHYVYKVCCRSVVLPWYFGVIQHKTDHLEITKILFTHHNPNFNPFSNDFGNIPMLNASLMKYIFSETFMLKKLPSRVFRTVYLFLQCQENLDKFVSKCVCYDIICILSLSYININKLTGYLQIENVVIARETTVNTLHVSELFLPMLLINGVLLCIIVLS